MLAVRANKAIFVLPLLKLRWLRRLLCEGKQLGWIMSVTLEIDDQALASLPLGPGERERQMEIELACRFYAKGWLSLGQASRMAKLDRYAFGVELAERGIPRQYGIDDFHADLRYGSGQ